MKKVANYDFAGAQELPTCSIAKIPNETLKTSSKKKSG